MAPLIGLACFLISLWFLFGMPIVVGAFAVKYYRNRTLPTGLLVAAIMLVVFYASAVSIWGLATASYWKLSFMTTFEAAGNAAKYGEPVEHGAEALLVSLIGISAVAAAVAGAATAGLRRAWLHRRRVAA